MDIAINRLGKYIADLDHQTTGALKVWTVRPHNNRSNVYSYYDFARSMGLAVLARNKNVAKVIFVIYELWLDYGMNKIKESIPKDDHQIITVDILFNKIVEYFDDTLVEHEFAEYITDTFTVTNPDQRELQFWSNRGQSITKDGVVTIKQCINEIDLLTVSLLRLNMLID